MNQALVACRTERLFKFPDGTLNYPGWSSGPPPGSFAEWCRQFRYRNDKNARLAGLADLAESKTGYIDDYAIFGNFDELEEFSESDSRVLDAIYRLVDDVLSMFDELDLLYLELYRHPATSSIALQILSGTLDDEWHVLAFQMIESVRSPQPKQGYYEKWTEQLNLNMNLLRQIDSLRKERPCEQAALPKQKPRDVPFDPWSLSAQRDRAEKKRRNNRQERAEPPAKLTPRVDECMDLLSAGLAPKQVAHVMGIGVGSVYKKMEVARVALGAATTSDAMVRFSKLSRKEEKKTGWKGSSR